ncbi:hypothetical protein EV188_111132 [Actinomycetospora succinea]|uniref:Uncharacterized protein n=1 Tax=Actinomycetospora succinea TaxID=663603 RepID=A0A4R6UPX1_9PSEU|nr:hypothetical protein [Actinomycetospora succinea]TDQ48962.1 hypothetical protein EV188_111132 [Actinomycetospora succinea]
MTAETPSSRGPAGSARPSRRATAARAVSYGVLARWGDRRQARADGRAGLPSLEPGRPAGTPALEEYHQDFLARVHRERLRLDRETAPMHQSRAGLAVRLPATEDALARARASLDAIPVLLDAAQLAVRRGGETHTAADVVAARRAREHEARRRPLVDEAARLHAQLTQMRAEYARLGSTIRSCELAAATRVRRLHARVMRRVSAYERHLVRRHPAGDRIGPALVDRHPVVPEWVAAAEAADPAAPETGPVSPPTGIPTPRPPVHQHPADQPGQE